MIIKLLSILRDSVAINPKHHNSAGPKRAVTLKRTCAKNINSICWSMNFFLFCKMKRLNAIMINNFRNLHFHDVLLGDPHKWFTVTFLYFYILQFIAKRNDERFNIFWTFCLLKFLIIEPACIIERNVNF